MVGVGLSSIGGAMEAARHGRSLCRLAASFAADVAGYSRLMEAGEAGALAALKTLRRALADPKIREHCGRIAKTRG
jgi:adenylate cyclase